MAHIESGGSGKKLNVELNLVPFIDLMSVLITFLLLTAVWTQVSMIQIGSSLYGKQSDQPPQIPPQADVVLKLEVLPEGFRLAVGSESKIIPNQNNSYDINGLLEILQQAKLKYPEKRDAAIAMTDSLQYELLIEGMDVLLKAGFPNISVLTGGP